MGIYLDNAATTRVDPAVASEVERVRRSAEGNASSIHQHGVNAAKHIEKARNIIAGSINAEAEEIVFTSGGTESNNTVLKGVVSLSSNEKKHIVISAIEHPSIIETARWLEEAGISVTYVSVDRDGFVSASDVEKALTAETVLVSIMHANNETGTIEPIKDIGRACTERGVLFHADACQSYTKIPLDVKEQNVDFITLNAHKIHGPKGVGALYVRKGVKIAPLLHGGEQEATLRSGTYNTEGIAGFGKAVEIAHTDDVKKMTELRDWFSKELSENIEGVLLNGPDTQRLSNIINLRIRSVDGNRLAAELDRRAISVGRGSSCSSSKSTPSHVLLALGMDSKEAEESIRISLNKWTRKKELGIVVKNMIEIVTELRMV
ncbi:MAG: cysteine desulfurase [Candidatus Omnitrophica bacterium]|nr:cysteine desulfurase [Candidatus Omnitrophota bacterium]